jgi:hypothetical protein
VIEEAGGEAAYHHELREAEHAHRPVLPGGCPPRTGGLCGWPVLAVAILASSLQVRTATNIDPLIAFGLKKPPIQRAGGKYHSQMPFPIFSGGLTWSGHRGTSGGLSPSPAALTIGRHAARAPAQ